MPSFFVRRNEGLCVDTSQLTATTELIAAVQQIFAENQYFLYLDYVHFIKLLYDVGPPLHHIYATSPLVRLAADIVAFQPERRALYRAVKISHDQAEYIFEPVFLTPPPIKQADETVPAITPAPSADAATTTTPQQPVATPKPVQIPTSLRFDEFVADMWSKDIRFGINEKVVRTAIESGKRDRCIIAKALPPQQGKPASIQEIARELHRDDAPAELPNGKLDLRQFKNRFPQIGKGVKLIKKIPLVMGIPGFDLAGKAIIPPVPADFDLASLAGPDTAVEQTEEGEFIVSMLDGFLILDSKTNQISISEKIINRDGVSARTTGDLHLSGDTYEEYGTVQEQRIVQGKNITIHADVFGTVSSDGGNITLLHNLIGGMAINQAGDITVNNVASGAVLKTRKGNVTIKHAERCEIIGTHVAILEAFNCDILADEVTVKVARGCTITAKSIHLTSAAAHKHSDMLVFVQIPDLSGFEKQSHELESKISEAEANLQHKHEELETIAEQASFKYYRLVATKLKNKEMSLTPEQQTRFRKLTVMVEPLLRHSAEISAKIKGIKTEQQQLSGQLSQLIAQQQADQEGINCRIDAVNGPMMVCTTTVKFNAALVHELSAKDWHAQLCDLMATSGKLFTGSSGCFAWQYQREDVSAKNVIEHTEAATPKR